MPRSALSIVKPAVDDIVAGRKRVEIRSWAPPVIPLRDLVLVQNTISCVRTGKKTLTVSRSRWSTSWGYTTGRRMKPARKASNGVPDTCAGN